MTREFATPSAMRAPTVELMKSAIDRRDGFADFMETHLSGIIVDYIKRKIQMDDIKHIWWIGGSRSWSNWYGKLSEKPSATKEELASIRASNFDVFFIANDHETSQLIACNLFDIVMEVKKELDPVLEPFGLSLEYEGRGITYTKSTCTAAAEPIPGELFPGYGNLLILRKKRLTRLRGSKKTTDDGKYDKYDGKLVLYLEVFLLENMNLEQFSSSYLERNLTQGLHYLNPLGLITFARFIKQARDDKDFDVDTKRLSLWNKVMQMQNADAYTVSAKIASTYEKVWKSSNAYDDEYVDMLYLDAWKLKSPVVQQLLDGFEVWIMQQVRPFVNACIIGIDDDFNSADKDNAFIMVVGGDAMRRYKDNVTQTKDIDCKVYVKGNEKSAAMRTVKGVVEKNISRLVSYLIQNKKDVFGNAGSNTMVHATDHANGVYVQIDFFKKESLQFRMREIAKNAYFPVNLYSVDYRCFVKLQFGGKTLMQKYTIPILDVVIQENEKSFKANTSVDRNFHVPVASLEWLLMDIDNTYHIKSDVFGRIKANKRQKDKSRFQMLRNIYKQLPGSRSISGRQKEDLDAVDERAYEAVLDDTNKLANQYYCLFKQIRTARKRKGFVKTQMPYDDNKLERMLTQKYKQCIHDETVGMDLD